MSSPTQRSLKFLRERGYTVGVVERWNPGAKVRQDFLGFADVLAVHAGEVGVLAVQVCGGGGGSLAERYRKIVRTPAAHVWLLAGNAILVQQWVRRPPLKGKKRIRVELREQRISINEVLAEAGGRT